MNKRNPHKTWLFRLTGAFPFLKPSVLGLSMPRGARTGARTVIETSALLRGELHPRHAALLRSARAGGPGKTNGADVYYPLDEARPSAAGLACRLGRSWAVPTGDQDPKARIAWGATPADVRQRFVQA